MQLASDDLGIRRRVRRARGGVLGLGGSATTALVDAASQ